jgi:hypothetical protein
MPESNSSVLLLKNRLQELPNGDSNITTEEIP